MRYVDTSLALGWCLGLLVIISSCTAPMFQRPTDILPELEILSVDSIGDASVQIKGKMTGSIESIEALGFILSNEGEPSITDEIIPAQLDEGTLEFTLEVNDLPYDEEYQVKAVVTTSFGLFATPSFSFRTPADNFVPIFVPCSPIEESITYINSRYTVSRLEKTIDPSYVSYVLVPEAAAFRYHIFFRNPPRPNIYATNESLSLTNDQVHIYITSGGVTRVVESGQEVYVEIDLVSRELIMTICDLKFENINLISTGKFTLP